MDKSLTRWKGPIFKIPFSRNSKSFVWKPNFFPRQAIQKLLFALQFHYTGDTPCRVWLDLDNSLTRWKRPIFKIPFSQNSKSSVWNSNFFAGQAIPQILFALHCHYTVDTQYRVWFDLDNSLTRWKKNYFWNSQKFAIRDIRKIPYENPNFFLGKLYQNFCFTLSLHWWYSILRLVWFGQLLNPMKKTFFKILFSRNSKSSVWNTNFFPDKVYHFFLLYALITLVILHPEFGLIWTTPWPDEKEFFFKILKNSQFAKFAKVRMKTHFFPRQAIPTTFLLCTLITLVILHTEFR